MKFVKVINTYKNINLEYGYLLKIDTIMELWLYHLTARQKLMDDGFEDFLNSRAFLEKVNYPHPSTVYGNYFAALYDYTEKSLKEIVIDSNERVFQNQCKGIIKEGYIYINKRGGYMYGNFIKEVSKIIEKNNFDFPDKIYTKKDIRIIQWQKGKHYYAKIGIEDVVVNNEQKWNTEQTAYKNAVKYLKNKLQKEKFNDN